MVETITKEKRYIICNNCNSQIDFCSKCNFNFLINKKIFCKFEYYKSIHYCDLCGVNNEK